VFTSELIHTTAGGRGGGGPNNAVLTEELLVSHGDGVLPAGIRDVAAELQLGATHFEAVRSLRDALSIEALEAIGCAVGHVTRAEPVVGPAVLQLTIDLQLEVAIGATDEEAVVVARGGGGGLQAGAAVGIGQHILHHAANLLRALLGQPLVLRLRLHLGELLFQLGDLGQHIGAAVVGRGKRAGGDRKGGKREGLGRLAVHAGLLMLAV